MGEQCKVLLDILHMDGNFRCKCRNPLRGPGDKTRGKNVTGKARELDIGKEKRFEKMWNKMQENP